MSITIVGVARITSKEGGDDDKDKHTFLEEYIGSLANQHMVNNYSCSVT